MLTAEMIEKANAKAKKYLEEKGDKCPTNLKEYVSASQRIKAFRMVCPNGSVVTEELPTMEGCCKFRCTLADENGMVLATATALKQTVVWDKYKNKNVLDTEALTKCETKAVGRACAFLGLGVDAGIASAEDMDDFQNSQMQQVADAIAQNPAGAVVNTAVPVGQVLPPQGYPAQAQPQNVLPPQGYPPQQAPVQNVAPPQGYVQVDAATVEQAKNIVCQTGYYSGKTLGQIMENTKGMGALTWIRDNCPGTNEGAGAAILLQSMLQ